MRFLLLFVLFLLSSCSQKEESMEDMTDRVFTLAVQKFELMDSLSPKDKCVVSADSVGNIISGGTTDWVSGFFPGSLWYVYEYTGDKRIRQIAEKRTKVLEPIKTFTDSHDVGFMMNCSFGNALRITGDTSYLEPLLTAAKSLSTRFNPNVGCIMSWNPSSKWKFPVIIDNMMNLELLFLASKLSGETRFDSIANCHARVTARNHFRPDFSSFHVIDYNPENGEVLHRQTAQGLSDSSSWARGQSWAVYGYTMAYRCTGNIEYLNLAKNIARYLMGRLPEDGIPYWDYDAVGDVRDASAGAILASALIQLYCMTHDDSYLKCSEKILRTLSGPNYLTTTGEYAGFLLKHSVGAKPYNSQVDVPLSYADYYFLEALLRYKSLEI